jgi:hypothetical protein
MATTTKRKGPTKAAHKKAANSRKANRKKRLKALPPLKVAAKRPKIAPGDERTFALQLKFTQAEQDWLNKNSKGKSLTASVLHTVLSAIPARVRRKDFVA